MTDIQIYAVFSESIIKKLETILVPSPDYKFSIYKTLLKDLQKPSFLSKKIDIILLPVEEEKSKLFDIAAKIKKFAPWIVIIAVTKIAGDKALEKYLKAGFDDCVTNSVMLSESFSDLVICALARKEFEKPFLKNLNIYQSLINESNEGIYIVEDNHFVFVNPAMTKILGYSKEELLSEDFDVMTTVHPDDVEFILSRLRDLKEGKKLAPMYTFRIIAKSGEIKFLELNTSAMKNALIQVLGLVRDITHKIKMEKEAFENSELLKILSESISDIVFIKDLSCRYIRVNSKMSEFFNAKAEEIIGKDDTAFAEAEAAKQIRDEDERVLRGEIFSSEVKRSSKAGTKVFHIVKVPLKDISGKIVGLCGLARDISDRVKREQDQVKLNRALKAVNLCNEALIRSNEEEILLQKICDIIVDTGGYRMAWVGYAQNNADKSIKPMAKAGFENGYLNNVKISWGDDIYGSGPAGKVIKSGQHSIIRNIHEDEKFVTWRKEAVKRGYSSIISMPINIDGRTIGCIAIYSEKIDAFSDDEIDLLTRLSEDLSFGIKVLRERKEKEQTESKLRENEKLFRLLAENATDIIINYRFKPEPGFEYISPSAEKITGFSVKEFYNDPTFFYKIIHPEDKSKLEKAIFSPSVEPATESIRLISKDGRLKWMELVSTPIINSNGDIIFLEAIIRDVSARIKAEEERNRLFNLSQDLLSIAGFDGYFKQLNPSWEKVLGWTGDELLQRPWLDFIHPDDREKTQKIDNRLRSGESVTFSDNRYLCKDGSYRWLSWNSYPIKEENLILSIARDITRIKETTEALKSLTDRYQTILDEVPNIIAEVDTESRYVWLNRMGIEFFGEDAVGRKASHYFIGSQDTTEKAREIFEGKKDTLFVESLQRRIDGEERLLAWWCKALKDSNGKTIGALSTAQDVTDLQNAISELIQSEDKYKNLVEQINDIVFAVDPNGVFTYVSPIVKQIGGWEPEEVIGKKFIDFIYHEDIPDIKIMFEERIKGKIEPSEFRVKMKTGDYKWVRTSSKLTRKDNIIVGLQGVLTDISEKKLAEDALRESEERFRAAFQTSPDAIYITRADDGLIIYSNDGFTSWTGYSKEEVFGKTALDLGIWVDSAERARLTGRLLKDNSLNNAEARFRIKGGRIRTVLISATALQLKNTKYFFFVVRDVDDWKKAEEALVQEKERLSITLKSIGEAVISIDLAGRIVLMNPMAEELTGWNFAEAEGKLLKDIFAILSEESKLKSSDLALDTIRSGESVEPAGNFILISKNCFEKSINFSASPLRDRENQIIGGVIIFRDISEKRQIEEELNKAQKLESIGILAGGIAHDFNNILSAILANISLVKITMPENQKSAVKLSDAEKAVIRAQGLTQQLLTFSLGGAPVKEVSDIKDILKETTLFILSGSKTKAEFDISEDLAPVDVDKGQFSQVINNIVLNADQAMPQGGTVKIKAVNTVILSDNSLRLEPGNYICISISDTGKGISSDNLSKIFDPYFTTKSKGTGLGLSTVYSIIRKHNGEIRVDSRPGLGAIFTIYLPVSKTAKITKQSDAKTKARTGGRILLMDDEQIIRDVAKEVLIHLGYEVSLAKDGESMIESFKKAKNDGKPFDAVILDLTIPGGRGGRDMFKELVNIDPAVKAIAASGYSNDPVMSDFRKYGFSGILPKPFTIKDVASVLERVLNSN